MTVAEQLADWACGGKAMPAEPQRSQWPLADEASSLPGWPAPFALHKPPSCPVRTSSASRATGAISAANTARHPSHAARRAQNGREVKSVGTD